MMARVLAALAVALMVAPWARAEDIFRSDRANGFAFEPVEARFVRVVLHGSSDGTQPCLDELEVYGADARRNLALALAGAKAKASSCLAGYAAHAVEHLNDGEYGNAKSWIPRGAEEEWAQVELAEAATVSRVVLSRDRLRQFGDRIPTRLEVLVSRDGRQWTRVLQAEARPVNGSVPGGGGGNGPSLPGPPPPPGRGAGVPADLRAPLTDSLGSPNLALAPGARATASSTYADGALPIHQAAHLNDGRLGNSFSWISKGEPSWAEVGLGEASWVYRVALGNDSSATYSDRAIRSFRVLTATEYAADSADPVWTAVLRVNVDALQLRQVFTFAPVRARWVRICLEPTGSGEARIDELEVYGTGEQLALDQIGPLTPQASEGGGAEGYRKWLRWALLGEEHAWLKTFGYADLDPGLVPYNGRVQQYPRHVPDDTVSLPTMAAAPALDGCLEQTEWLGASRGVARVAVVDDVDRGPLVETAVWCGRRGNDLFLALDTNRVLSTPPRRYLLSRLGRLRHSDLDRRGSALQPVGAAALGPVHPGPVPAGGGRLQRRPAGRRGAPAGLAVPRRGRVGPAGRRGDGWEAHAGAGPTCLLRAGGPRSRPVRALRQRALPGAADASGGSWRDGSGRDGPR